MVVSYKTHYETIANNAVTSATVSDTTTYGELMQIVGELLGEINAECLNSNCSFTITVNDSIVSSIGLSHSLLSFETVLCCRNGMEKYFSQKA